MFEKPDHHGRAVPVDGGFVSPCVHRPKRVLRRLWNALPQDKVGGTKPYVKRRTQHYPRARDCRKRRGVKFGRPVVAVDAGHVARLRSSGLSWRDIAAQSGIAKVTLRRSTKVFA